MSDKKTGKNYNEELDGVLTTMQNEGVLPRTKPWSKEERVSGLVAKLKQSEKLKANPTFKEYDIFSDRFFDSENTFPYEKFLSELTADTDSTYSSIRILDDLYNAESPEIFAQKHPGEHRRLQWYVAKSKWTQIKEELKREFPNLPVESYKELTFMTRFYYFNFLRALDILSKEAYEITKPEDFIFE